MVKEYRLRNTYGDGTQEAEEIVEGMPTWKMQVHVHQVGLLLPYKGAAEY